MRCLLLHLGLVCSSDLEAGGSGPVATSHMQSCQSLVATGGRLGWRTRRYRVIRRKCDPETVAAAGSCAERWRFSAEEIDSARRSVLIENERKAQKAG